MGKVEMATETAAPEVPASVSDHLTLEDRVGLLRAMLTMRGIEERAMTLYRQGKGPGSFYGGFGQEAGSAASRRSASSASTWAAPAASRAGATATSTSASAGSAASGWCRCCPT